MDCLCRLLRLQYLFRLIHQREVKIQGSALRHVYALPAWGYAYSRRVDEHTLAGPVYIRNTPLLAVLGSDPFWEAVAAQIPWLRKGKARQEWALFAPGFRTNAGQIRRKLRGLRQVDSAVTLNMA